MEPYITVTYSELKAILSKWHREAVDGEFKDEPAFDQVSEDEFAERSARWIFEQAGTPV